jgi:hypothetical protein
VDKTETSFNTVKAVEETVDTEEEVNTGGTFRGKGCHVVL